MLEQNKSLDLNLYEVRIDDTLLNDETLLNSLLYECQCAIFLIDITCSESLAEAEKLLRLINRSQYPYLTCILVQNKSDEDSTRKINTMEIQNFLQKYDFLDSIEISLKTENNLKELLQKINTAINEKKNNLPMNIVTEAIERRKTLINTQGSLSFILIGDSTVGKTCFLTRYFKNSFTELFLSTIGIEKETKNIRIGNDNYKITLWDTAGQERFKCLPRKYYQNADGILLLFDVCSEETFNNVSNWIKDVKDNSNKKIGGEGQESEMSLFLIGNKIDKPDRQVFRQQAEELAKSLGMKYFEISCKYNINIPEVMARMILESFMKANHVDDYIKLSTAKNKSDNKKGVCCMK